MSLLCPTSSSSVLALCVLMVVFVAGLALPIPPKLVAIKTQELFRKSENTNPQDEEVAGTVLEYYDDGLISPSRCEDHCTLTYPTHTYPVVENHLACRQGCILVQLGEPLETCKLECSKFYSTEAEQFACSVGCSKHKLTQKGEQMRSTLLAVSSVRTTSLGFSLFDLKENLKHYFWGSSTAAADNGFQWEDPQRFMLGNGQELFFLSGHSNSLSNEKLSLKELFPPELPSALFQEQDIGSFSHPSLVYVSKSILHTVHHRTFINKLLFSVGVVLLLVGAPMLILSIIVDLVSAEKKSEVEVNKNEEKVAVMFKTPHPASCPHMLTELTDMSSKFSPKEMTSFSPVSVILESNH